MCVRWPVVYVRYQLTTCSNTVISVVVDWEAVVKLSDDFNGADLRNVCCVLCFVL